MKDDKTAPDGTEQRDPVKFDILTERMRLRRHSIADFGHSAALWSDADVVRYISGKPSTRSESWSRLLRYIGHWQALAFGYWVVEDRLTGQFLGEVGLADYKRDMTPPLGPWPEIGWVMAPQAQGRGLASEAVAAALEWSDRMLAAERTVCIIDPEHSVSLRVAAKNGFVERSTGEIGGSPVVVMERLKAAI